MKFTLVVSGKRRKGAMKLKGKLTLDREVR
jgi:hypothetical protein